ncbi:MAG TPA: hypothetical protein PKC72_08265 [Chitinophagaceae bacterium]|nr:hypothetical protein [Chitinophagaceae bacterium]
MTNYRLLAIILIFTSCGSGNGNVLKEVKKIDHYPSASGIEYFNNKHYVIGDDANYILILDSNMKVKDSIVLFASLEKRLPKSVKPDLESMTMLPDSNLLLLGSGSLAPFRNRAWIVDLASERVDSIRLDTFYSRLSINGLKELNIEGLCRIPGYFLISNRGNKSFRKNHLILVDKSFWKEQSTTPVTLIRVGNNADSSLFSGISGLTYSEKSDKLLLTVSTENTMNNIDDGEIGKSYLWIIDDISSKKKWAAINPNRIIDLEKIDTRFKGQKIESVCITEETKHFLHLVLAADNDDGSSTLFKIIVEKD